MIKICIKPEKEKLAPTHGIGRVIHAQHKYLPAYGFEFVDDPKDSDVYIGHTQDFGYRDISILACHGLYWTGDKGSGNYTDYAYSANRSIIDAARRALAIVVPSQWVSMPFKRDMRLNPVVIGHGIDFDEWQIGKPQGYALWNKNRNFDVCNPQAAYELAKRGVEVVTTFAPPNIRSTKNLQVIGTQDAPQMKEIIEGATVYLSTVKETFGIGTLEAMACGVPVLGWDYGGTAEIVTNGVDGILVKPGDYEALYTAYHDIIAHRDEMSIAARATASRYTWTTAIAQYADLFQQVYKSRQEAPHGVSFVITAYNYGQYINEAVDSVLAQSIPPAEVVVVDDGSNDDTLDRLKRYRDTGVKVITQENRGVAAARTVGIEHTTQPYIVCLDADDKLDPGFTAALLPEMEADRGLGIAYTGIVGFSDMGGIWETDFPPEFSWAHQAQNTNPPANCIPSACMFRREMWLRAGPHKQEYAPGEDAEFWTRGLSVGFTAKRVTTDRLFRYRLHADSNSRKKQYKSIDDRLPWLRDHIFPFAAPVGEETVPHVRSYSQPLVSIIIAVMPHHAAHLDEAIDSVLGQTLRDWELIVVDDTFRDNTTEIPQAFVQRYPFANWLIDGKQRGLNAARNYGISEVKAPLMLFLDPEDVLMPNALQELLKGVNENNGVYAYGDTQIVKAKGQPQIYRALDFPSLVQSEERIPKLAALYPTEWIMSVGGYDENSAHDENDLFVRLAMKAYCGHHINQAILVYREYLSPNGRAHQGGSRYLGGFDMSCCGGNGAAVLAAKMAAASMPSDINTYSGDPVAGLVLMNYTGKNPGAYTYNGNGGRTYQGGDNDIQRQAWVHPSDVEILARTTRWVVAPPPPKEKEVKPVVEAVETVTALPQVEAVATVTPAPAIAVTTDSLTSASKKKARK